MISIILRIVGGGLALIFIAYIAIIDSPFFTKSPTLRLTLVTVPGIGERKALSPIP
jgi:hypothetical protein